MKDSRRNSRTPFIEPATNGQRVRLWTLGVATVLLLCAIVVSLIGHGFQLPASGCTKSGTEYLTQPIPSPAAFADRPTLTMYVLDVGQGDSLLLRSPSGKTMLVDAGTEDAASAVLTALKTSRTDWLDAVVATHPHTDHIGGMAYVLQRYPADIVYVTNMEASTPEYERFSAALGLSGAQCVIADSETEIVWDDAVTVTVLNPIRGQAYGDANNASIVLKVTYGDISFLLTGDAEAETEMLLYRAYGSDALKADVLKLGHHGSNTSSCAKFLDATAPEYAVVSTGRDNPYGHPHESVLNRLQRRGVTLYRTDLSGVITVCTDGQSVVIVP